MRRPPPAFHLLRDLEEALVPGRTAVAVVPDAGRPARVAAHGRLAARWLGCAGGEVVLALDPLGRPIAPAHPALHLSRSSREGLCALAVAAVPVGVDLERRDGGEVPWNVLAAPEAALLRRLGPSAFPVLWAVKEAALKALGAGLAGAGTVTVTQDDRGAWIVRDEAGGRHLSVATAEPADGWVLAVVTADAPTSPD